MHDDLLERRIRATLKHEGDGLPFTITPAELERRLALRGRMSAGRRTALLLAATVGIGLLGVGASIGGILDNSTPAPDQTLLAETSPSPSTTVRPTNRPTNPPAPIALAGDRPGWQLSAGTGPNLSYDPTPQAFTGPVAEAGGQFLVVVVCAGTGPMEVTVDVGRKFGERQEVFNAICTPEGAETAQSFEADASYVTLIYAEPVGSWTALSLLVPDPLVVQ